MFKIKKLACLYASLLGLSTPLLASNAPDVDQMQDYTYDSLICTFDTSINRSHEALIDANISGMHDIDTGQYYDEHPRSNHATHLASLTFAIAPNVNLFVIPGFGGDITAEQQNKKFETALEVCANESNHYARTIVSIPGGTVGYSLEVEKLLLKLTEKGIGVITAAGNHQNKRLKDDYFQYPAAYPTTLAIGSVNLDSDISEFSARNKSVDLVAWGENVPGAVTSDTGESELGYLSGTSQAVAIVVGLITKLWALHPDLDFKTISNAVFASARDLGEPGKDSEYGYGQIDIVAADKFLAQIRDNVIPDTHISQWYDLKQYNKGDTVYYKGLLYRAKYWVKGEKPTGKNVWQLTGEFQWNDLNAYNEGDTVYYKGGVYRAKDFVEIGVKPTATDVWQLTGELLYEAEGFDYRSQLLLSEIYPNKMDCSGNRCTIYCESWSLNCGGGGSSGGYGGGRGYGGNSGFGSSSKSGFGFFKKLGKSFIKKSRKKDAKAKEEEKAKAKAKEEKEAKAKEEKAKQEEYDDVKKRSDTKIEIGKNETLEDFYNRAIKHFTRVADDYEKWDKKWKPGDHAQKIIDSRNGALKYRKKLISLRNDKDRKNGMKNHKGGYEP